MDDQGQTERLHAEVLAQDRRAEESRRPGNLHERCNKVATLAPLFRTDPEKAGATALQITVNVAFTSSAVLLGVPASAHSPQGLPGVSSSSIGGCLAEAR